MQVIAQGDSQLILGPRSVLNMMSHVTHENHCSFVIVDTFYKTCSQSDLLLWLHDIVQDKMGHSPSTTTLPMTDATSTNSTHSTLVKDELFSLIAHKNQVVRHWFERPCTFLSVQMARAFSYHSLAWSCAGLKLRE